MLATSYFTTFRKLEGEKDLTEKQTVFETERIYLGSIVSTDG